MAPRISEDNPLPEPYWFMVSQNNCWWNHNRYIHYNAYPNFHRLMSAIYSGINLLTSQLCPWQRHHNGRDSVSNHQPHDCFPNRLFRRRSKKTSKLHVTGLCTRNSPRTGEFPAKMASNAENVSIWWRHHVNCKWIAIIHANVLAAGRIACIHARFAVSHES